MRQSMAVSLATQAAAKCKVCNMRFYKKRHEFILHHPPLSRQLPLWQRRQRWPQQWQWRQLQRWLPGQLVQMVQLVRWWQWGWQRCGKLSQLWTKSLTQESLMIRQLWFALLLIIQHWLLPVRWLGSWWYVWAATVCRKPLVRIVMELRRGKWLENILISTCEQGGREGSTGFYLFCA